MALNYDVVKGLMFSELQGIVYTHMKWVVKCHCADLSRVLEPICSGVNNYPVGGIIFASWSLKHCCLLQISQASGSSILPGAEGMLLAKQKVMQ